MAETASDSTIQEDFNCAVISGDLRLISLLVKQVEINKTNKHGVTPLFIAIENGNMEVIRVLIDSGADINVESYSHSEGLFEIPLATAVRTKQRVIVELLLGCGCQMEGVAEGKSPLHWAASHGNISVAELLLENGADINHVGPFLHSPLHFAVLADQEEMVCWLLANGAHLLENGDDRNPLHLASFRGNCSIVSLLLDHGCAFDARDRFNFLPFSLACLRGHLDVVKLFVEKTSGSVDLNDGLLHAAEAGYLSVIEYLVCCGADINYRNVNGETVLTVAAARGQYQVVLMMLNLGVEINVIDNRKYTPLLLSVIREHVDLVTTLVIHCGDLLLPAEMAESPTRMAYSLRHPMLLKLFLLAGLGIVDEPWFTKQNLETELKVSDFTIPASRRNIWETRVVKEAWIWLGDRVHQPLKLKEGCRIVIRRQLSRATNGRSILRRIELLPFPKRIQKYIKFDDLLIE